MRAIMATIAAGFLVSLYGCGGGSGTTAGADLARGVAHFDVNVTTGAVTITYPAEGRAIFSGRAASFTSTELLSVGGDSGQRVLTVTTTNWSRQTWGASPVEFVVTDLTGGGAHDTRGGTDTETFAGSGASGSNDGYRTDARFANPNSAAFGNGPNAGCLFVADGANHTIRQIQADGMVSTFAGLAGASGSTNGTGAAARFYSPQDVAVDLYGNVFVADGGNHMIRRITPLGEVSLVAGTGASGNTNGPGNSATFATPAGIVVSEDGNTLYVACYNGHTIRKITYAGGLRNMPASYVVDTIAGTGAAGYVDGAGGVAQFRRPWGLCVFRDQVGNETLFVADVENAAVRRIQDPATSPLVSTVAGGTGAGSAQGPGSVAKFTYPTGCDVIPVDPDTFVLFVTDRHRVSGIYPAPGSEPRQAGNYEVVTLAGDPSPGFGDGDGYSTYFNYPEGVCVARGMGPAATLYIADTVNHRIRKTDVPSRTHTGGVAGGDDVRVLNWDREVPHGNSWAKVMSPTGDPEQWTAELQFYVPRGASGFSFNAYVQTDTSVVNLPGSGVAYVTTLAGDGNRGSLDGLGKQAQFHDPWGVVSVPSSFAARYRTASGAAVRAFIADASNHRIRYLDASGSVGTFAGSSSGYADGIGLAARFYWPAGVALHPDGSLLVSDAQNHRIRRVWTNGQVTTVAGDGTAGSTDGTGDVARFDRPWGIAVTSGGTIFVTDYVRHTVRRIDQAGTDPTAPSSYTVSTAAGVSGTPGNTDGQGSGALFNGPAGICADSDGVLYVADSFNSSVRALRTSSSPPALVVVTLATILKGPGGIATDTAHNVYVSETDLGGVGHRVTRVSPSGDAVTIAGQGVSGFVDGRPGRFNQPWGVAVEETGTVLVADTYNHSLRAIQRFIRDGAHGGKDL